MSDQANVHQLHVVETEKLTLADRCRALETALLLTAQTNQQLRVELSQSQVEAQNLQSELARIRHKHLMLLLEHHGYIDVDQHGAPA